MYKCFDRNLLPLEALVVSYSVLLAHRLFLFEQGWSPEIHRQLAVRVNQDRSSFLWARLHC